MKKRFIPSLAAALGLVVALGGAVAAYDVIRPWATRYENEVVAGRSCENHLRYLKAELRAIERDIMTAQSQGNNAWFQSLLDQKSAILQEVERVKRECGWG